MQRPSRYLERQGTMGREKRGLDSAEGVEDRAPDPKRHKVPALASVIVEALKVDSLQKLCSSLEPILRRVVSEEVERALAKLGPARLGGSRSSPKRIEGPDGRNLQLHFRTRLSLPLFTAGKVEGEQGAAIHVVLLDSDSGHVVTSGTESSTKLDVVVLEGDFNNEDDEDWTEEDFESHVVKEREGKRPLLTGDLQLSLKEGVGTLGELTFTDNSSWIRSRKFRLGVRVATGYCEGIRIREAKTEAFSVKDHRGELYKKHYPPALQDEVWRLEKIGKDGSFHKRLNKNGIYTVEDFLRLVVRDSQRLRNILGSGMSNKMWEILVEHAKTCVLSGKYYVYYSDVSRSVGAIFNNIYELSGLIARGQYYSAESLTDSQKIFVDTLVKKAYDDWMNVIEYDGKALMNFSQSKKNAVKNISSSCSTDYQQVSQPNVSISEDAAQAQADSQVASVGFSDNQGSRYSSNMYSNKHQLQYESSSYVPQSQFATGSSNPNQGNLNLLALGPPHASSFSAQPSSLSASPYDDWGHTRESRVVGGGGVDDFLSEDEIRMRSHELLENEDMQHLLRVLSMGGGAGAPDIDPYGLQGYIPSPPGPSFSFEDDRSRHSGKAVVGWLKIKAAMRWGIFVRKKAAERRRAQLVELDDE